MTRVLIVGDEPSLRHVDEDLRRHSDAGCLPAAASMIGKDHSRRSENYLALPYASYHSFADAVPGRMHD